MSNLEPAKILVVDDNPSTLYSTSRVLRGVGFTVFEAATGEAGVELAQQGVDAVVLDVNLPDISGIEVCRRLRNNPATTRVPVIHLSASFVKDADKVFGLEAGADGYLTHPVEPPVLIATVNAFLRARSAENERERLLISEQAARAEAERANRLKDDFLATLSHELRTPLNAIVGWSQLLRSGPVDPDELAEGLEAIERNAKMQNQLVSDLLDVSRITSGKVRLDISPIDPVSVIDAALDVVKPAAQAKKIEIRRTLDGLPLTITGDASRLQQILWNLITNSVKFTPRDGNITIALQRADSHVQISVTDNGEGIDPELLPHIFDRFRQGDASTTRSYGGLGLGLSIVKHLIEMHGGTVSATSAGKGKGSTFTLHLPLSIVAQPSEEEPKAHGGATQFTLDRPTTKPNIAGLHILILDDDEDGRGLLRRVLQSAKAEVTEAANATDALAKLAATKPDVIISDVGMPAIDGYQFIRTVRAGGQSADSPPAIALTAFARPEDRSRAMLAGYQVHLSKPVDTLELFAAIAMLAGRAIPN